MNATRPKTIANPLLLALGGLLLAGTARAQSNTSAAHAAMSMPSFDASAIPSGNAGSSELLVRPSQDQPNPGMDGAFRTVCEFSHMNEDDPILYPGEEGAAHLHAYFGNTDADAYSTAESLKTTGDSTCRGGIANRSAYWAPALIDQHGTPQTPTVLHVYYKTGWHVQPAEIQPFPDGLRMIAGDAKASGAQANTYWECMNEGRRSASIPKCQPGATLAMTVEFPQCWDGKSLDADDHKSHMAYPEGGSCPASHPVAIPAITYRVEYLVPSEGIGDWRLASDMYDPELPGGYSAHADWFEGWDPQVAKAFVTQCLQRQLDCHSHLLGDGREVYY